MIKRLGIVLLIVLALNFLAVAGGAGFLLATGKLDRAKAIEIGKVLYPDPPPTSQPATKPVVDEGDPLFQISEILDKQAGKTAAEQVTVVREAYEALRAQLDRQRREMVDMKRQVDLAQTQVLSARSAIEKREKALADRLAAQKKLDSDEGFKKSLSIYDEMSPKQLKDLFLNMDDGEVVRYLQAMEPRRVSRIVKEFTSPAELTRVQTLLDQMRKNDVVGPQDAGSASAGAPR